MGWPRKTGSNVWWYLCFMWLASVHHLSFILADWWTKWSSCFLLEEIVCQFVNSSLCPDNWLYIIWCIIVMIRRYSCITPKDWRSYVIPVAQSNRKGMYFDSLLLSIHVMDLRDLVRWFIRHWFILCMGSYTKLILQGGVCTRILSGDYEVVSICCFYCMILDMM